MPGVRLNYATTHNHPKPPTTTTHNLPLPSITTHHQPKYIHHHPPQSKIYPSKKVFCKKNIKIFYSEVNDEKHFNYLVSNKLCQFLSMFFIRISSHWLTEETWLADLQLLRNLFFIYMVFYFYYIHKKWFKKILVWTNIYIKNYAKVV